MLFIICMFVGILILAFGMRMSVATIKNHAGEKNSGVVLAISLIIVLIGLWMFSNAMECYQYIVSHGAMELLF